MSLRPRLTAYKLHIDDLYAGTYIREENRSYLETAMGPVTRVRLLGTIMQRYDNPEKRYISLTLDDATETIRLKAWREDTEKLTDYQIGDIIDVIGKVRQQDDGELFVVPENVIKVEDVNVELLRELEIMELHQLISNKTMPKKKPATKLKTKAKIPPKKKPEKEPEPEPERGEPLPADESDVRDEVMQLIRTLDKGKGAHYKDLVEQAALDEDAVETAILDLLNEGVIYEPEPGRYKEL